MKIKLGLLLGLLICVSAGYSQKFKQVSGSLSPLKGQKTINLVYNYDGLKVGKMTEANYITKKTTDYNQDEPGKGDKWRENWIEDRSTRYQPKFEDLFNKNIASLKMEAEEGAVDAKYSLIITTTMIEPGFNVGVTRKPASINMLIELVETSNPDKILSKTTVLKVPGKDAFGMDYDSGVRISEAYAKLGKELGKYIAKNIKK